MSNRLSITGGKPSLAQIKGAGGGKGAASQPKQSAAREDPNTLRSKATARLLDVVSEGPILGIVDGLKSVYFDKTAVQNEDDSFNFDGVSVHQRIGESDQDPMPGFPSIERDTGVGVRVLQNTPVVRTITDANVDAVRVTIRIPALSSLTSNGSLVGTSVRFAIDVQEFGGAYVEVLDETISGKTTSPYDIAYRLELPVGGSPWDIRVRRITADSDNNASLSNDTFWSFYTEVIDHRLIYPDTAYLGVVADSALFGGSVPQRAYEIDGLLIQVPNNYDTVNREYAGVWDGTFKIAWSNNPAWVFYDLITHNRYGLGQWINSAEVDKWSLYEIAQYCDGTVDDGFGGEEPRFTFNGVINSREDALKVLQLIASVFRGMAFWASSTITASQDKPTDPVVLVTPDNVIDGQFDYSGTGLKTRNSVVIVSWNDPEDSYLPALEVVEDAELIERYGYKTKDITTIGVTSRGQAHRIGKWILDSQEHETETVTYRASFDHMIADGTAVFPGDVISVQDPSYAGVRFGGRLVAGAAGEVTLDAPVELEVGETYQLSAVLPDGTVETKSVSTGAGSTDTLALSDDFSAAPATEAMWVLTASNVAPRQFRVLGVREIEKNIVEVVALLHDPDKYARVEQGVVLEETSFSVVPSGAIPAPSNLSITEYIYQSGSAVQSAVTLSWTPPQNDPRVLNYEVQVRQPDATYATYAVVSDVQVDIDNTSKGAWSFRVRALDAAGTRSEWAMLENQFLDGLDVTPANVTGFEMQVLDDQVFLSWDAVTDLSTSFLKIKSQPVLQDALWGSGTVIVNKVSRDATGVTLPAVIGTYMIKAVSYSGVESEEAALVVSNVAALSGLNVVEESIQEPTWAGVREDVVTYLGELILDSSDVLDDWDSLDEIENLMPGPGFVSTGTYYFDDIVDLGEVYTSRLTAEINASARNPSNVMSAWGNLSTLQSLSGAGSTQWEVILQVSASQVDPEDDVWSAWAPLTVGDYTARAYRFRAILSTSLSSITPAVDGLKVTIDMPDRVDGVQAVPVPEEGVTVAYTYPFRVKPAVAITIQEASEGDQAVLSDETAEGFTVQILSGSVGVARSINWVAKGYGRKQSE